MQLTTLGNPWIESLWGRMKREQRSRLSEAETIGEPEQIINERFFNYNGRRQHSTIGNRPPLEYLRTNGNDTTPVLAQI